MTQRRAAEQLAIERSLVQFEGLVCVTARQIIRDGVELEEDDVLQLLWIKVWQSVESWNAEHSRQLSLRRWVFGNVRNVRKDIVKRPRRGNASIDDLRSRERSDRATTTLENGLLADWFDGRYLSVDADEVYAEVEDEPVPLPSTLTRMERRVVRLRLQGRRLEEIDHETGLSRSQRERVMRSIRVKLADWAPTPPPGRSGPTPPLRVAEPTRAPVAA